MKNRNELVWNFVLFDHLDLFRISDFEFRAFSLLLVPWRTLLSFDFAQDMLCASDNGATNLHSVRLYTAQYAKLT